MDKAEPRKHVTMMSPILLPLLGTMISMSQAFKLRGVTLPVWKRGSFVPKAYFSHDSDHPLHPLVVSGPSGVGKGTLINSLLDSCGDQIAFAVSHTTRKPRPGEVEGREYFYVNHDDMKQAINNDEFVEYVEIHGNLYGTSIKAIEDVIDHGKICILDIDVQGVQSLQKLSHQDELGVQPNYVFISPPSYDELKNRLINRNTETKEQMNIRLTRAKSELDWMNENQQKFNAIIVNDDMTKSIDKFKAQVQIWYPQLKFK